MATPAPQTPTSDPAEIKISSEGDDLIRVLQDQTKAINVLVASLRREPRCSTCKTKRTIAEDERAFLRKDSTSIINYCIAVVGLVLAGIYGAYAVPALQSADRGVTLAKDPTVVSIWSLCFSLQVIDTELSQNPLSPL